MKKKILVSTLIILVVVAASLGATMAWFTDQSDPIENTFTAGTVEIEADESWAVGHTHRNWNPGDCTGKEIKVRVVGTKRVFIRADIEEKWSILKALDSQGNVIFDGLPPTPRLASPSEYVYHDRTAPNIKWQVRQSPTDVVYTDWDDNGLGIKWQKVGSHWYYAGILTPPVQGDSSIISEILVTSRVCLDGRGTSNAYQGASYSLKINFEAIQVTHEAAFEQWGAGFHNGQWYPVVASSGGSNTIYLDNGIWKLNLGETILTWGAHGTDPNVKSFQP